MKKKVQATTELSAIEELQAEITSLKAELKERDRRIAELLHASNRYQQEARDCRLDLRRLEREKEFASNMRHGMRSAVEDLLRVIDGVQKPVSKEHPLAPYFGPVMKPSVRGFTIRD